MDYLKEAPPVIRDFLIYMETIMGRSPQTVSAYYRDLRIFFRFWLQKYKKVPENTDFDNISIDSVDIDVVKTVTRSDILDFLIFCSHDRPKYHKSPSTTYGNEAKSRARKISALRSFYKYYCDKVQLLDKNPTANLDPPKPKKSLPKFLSLEDSVKLLESIGGKNAQRDFCIITLFLNCGMRVSELAGINLTDIDGDRIRILGKGNKERMIYLNQACQDAIKAYLPYRITPKASQKNALFISQQGNRINVQTVKALVSKHLKQANLSGKHISAHKLRHTSATLMYQNGVDVRTLKEVLGHENLNTTMIYTHVVDQNLRDAADANPLSNIKIKTNKPKKATE